MSRSLDTTTVLVIENDENNLLVTERLLELAGAGRVFSFCSVAETLALLSDRVDLVLLDIELGQEDGAALLPRLREDGRFAAATIAALTANVLPQEVQKAQQAGFDGFLGKPLNFERFPEQLHQLLNGIPVWQTR